MKPLVYIVDPDNAVRESLAQLVAGAGVQAVTFPSAYEFLPQAKAEGPSALIVNTDLPGLSGLRLQELIAADRADVQVVFTSSNCDVPSSVRAMKAGAVDYLKRPFSDDALLAAVREALQRSEAAIQAREASRSLRDAYASLTRREREVMELVVSGLLNKQVGSELGISEITVKTHRGSVMRKMKADSLADLVRIAGTLGVRRFVPVRRPAPAWPMAAAA